MYPQNIEYQGEIIGVKMDWIGGLMLKFLPDDPQAPIAWLSVRDYPWVMKCRMNDTIKRAIDWWKDDARNG